MIAFAAAPPRAAIPTYWQSAPAALRGLHAERFCATSSTHRRSDLAWTSEARLWKAPPNCRHHAADLLSSSVLPAASVAAASAIHPRTAARPVLLAPPTRDSRRSVICDDSRALRLETSSTSPSCQRFWSTPPSGRPRRATPPPRLHARAGPPSLRRPTARPCHPSHHERALPSWLP